jgi:hypothetical protein
LNNRFLAQVAQHLAQPCTDRESGPQHSSDQYFRMFPTCRAAPCHKQGTILWVQVISLATALRRLPSLQIISLAALGLKLPGATKIVGSLTKGACLKKLDFSGNVLISPSHKASEVFATELADLSTLTVRPFLSIHLPLSSLLSLLGGPVRSDGFRSVLFICSMLSTRYMYGPTAYI